MGSVFMLIMVFLSGCAVGKDTDPIDSPPTASFSHSPAFPVVGSAVQFTDTSTGNPTSWQWNFGDGTTSNAQNPSHSFTTTGSYTVTLTANNSFGSDSANHPVTVVTPFAIIVDHNCTKLANIPSEWITTAKQTLHIAYGTASHGSQLYYGATKLVTWAYGGSKYAFNNGGSGGALDWRIWIGNFANLNMATSLDLDQNQSYNNTAWEAATRAYLATNPGVNVIMWAWCYGANTTEANINLYLSLMSGLEADFPNIKFVYMTGHSNGTGESGNLHIRNQQIRNYCITNNKILYDFYDIECWDPNGNYYGNRNISADLSYTGGNWGSEYAAANPQPSSKWFDCSECYGAHSHPLNCNVKIFAAWHLFARLAGWDGRVN
jgi:PKD repeat protein